MENSADSYLHKKFKKQLSIEPKPQNYDKENKDSTQTVELSEERIIEYKKPVECKKVSKNQSIDNKETVPIQSTNLNSPSYVLNSTNFSKSSISVEKCIANQQSSNSCISYVVSNNQNNEEDFKTVTFDTPLSTDPTNCTVSVSSSILDNLYSKENYLNKEDISSYNLQETCILKINSTEEMLDVKTGEIQPPPDRNSGGKYVCTYCNLVCSKPSVLQKHIRAHTNERPYPCINCGFSFKTRSNLYKHFRSRTHANRVMGNKTQEPSSEMDNQNEKYANCAKNSIIHLDSKEEKALSQDAKLKPYKPRFHTGKQFLENTAKENVVDERQNNKHATSELLSHHINEIINKNNSIINSRESTFMKKRLTDVIVDNAKNNEYVQRYNPNEHDFSCNSGEQRVTNEEPLNLTNKNRKRCMSEIAEPVVQKSLIKELLLKNLYSSDMQCPYCKMIFQTVTELDVHKYRNCKGKPSGARYTRSSSVNVASILTQNKNAFDNIPQLQNSFFSLNSPGPFLGKTRLVDTDKSKSFSFDSGNLPLMSPNELPQNYLLSPLPFDKEKKAPIKLFGGEVKIHSSGETKSFKIDNHSDKYEQETNYADYGGKLSENRVIKSSLQSGGTVLTNKTNYNKQDIRTSQDIIRVYENTSLSPSIDITSLSKPKFSFDRQSDTVSENLQSDTIMHNSVGDLTVTSKSISNVSSPLNKYNNIIDFSQKAVKMLTPNIKQPNFSIPGLPLPNKLIYKNLTGESKADLKLDSSKSKPDNETNTNKQQNLDLENFDLETKNSSKNSFDNNFVQFLQKKVYYEPPPKPPTSNLYNPVNLLVDGKVIRYVPGIPGPIAAEDPVDMAYGSIIAVERPIQKIESPVVPEKAELSQETFKITKSNSFLHPENVVERINKSPKFDTLEIKTDLPLKTTDVKSPIRISESKSPVKSLDVKSPIKTFEIKSPDSVNLGEMKKFARPNSLALKPTSASLKQHHGLTPTMFNQILISPDTPRVAKKYAEHFLHGNYFSYLGLKSSTKPVYCTLNKTQPFYVPHFKKLSMYSEWRQQDTKTDKLYVSNYDSRQKTQKYTMAGETSPNLIIHSSYKFMVSEVTSSQFERGDDQQRNSVLGGYESNEDYTYIRGRGRGRYVCDQCGIRCKKPSMLKKHIRTHSNDRPYTCSHCNFSFKTKGNLTKHMKSKAHTKNYTASNSSSSSTQQSITQSSESDTDDSGMDSSDESTRQQEHEAAYGLLSLSQKPTQTSTTHLRSDIGLLRSSSPLPMNDLFMTTEEIAYVSKTSFAKNKILDERNSLSFSSTKNITAVTATTSEETTEAQNIRNYLGKSSVNRPLTYPYTSLLLKENEVSSKNSQKSSKCIETVLNNAASNSEHKCIKQFHVIQKYAVTPVRPPSPKTCLPESPSKEILLTKKLDNIYICSENLTMNNKNLNTNRVVPTLKVNDEVINPTENVSDLRKRKYSVLDNNYKKKIQKNDEVMDLSMTTVAEKNEKNDARTYNLAEENCFNQKRCTDSQKIVSNEFCNVSPKLRTVSKSPQSFNINEDKEELDSEDLNCKINEISSNDTVVLIGSLHSDGNVNVNKEQQIIKSIDPSKNIDYDNSAMETLADIATQREKLDKNTLAKNVATEFLKLATKNESLDGCRDSSSFGPVNKDVNDIIVKSEGNKSCTICSKSFNKPSQLRLHMNIHYLERPFRCDSCSVSFRTKGHLQKHERSASHHNKLSSSPALSSSEPRPFKCSDCNIAFRIHGHLAKHLRSKMHIMKLECLAKIPFGLYAELERSNSLLTEINTCDGDQCLESLKSLAKKVFINDPNKLNQLELRENVAADT